MTDEIKDFSAFPCAAFSPSDDFIHQRGMSIRDWFAGMAMNAFISNGNPKVVEAFSRDPDNSYQDFADCSYLIADAMMKARQK